MPTLHGLYRSARPSFAVAALLTGVIAAAPAYALVLRGPGLSDSGLYGTLVFRVHPVGAGLVGKVRCVNGTGACLARRYRVSLTTAPDGSFVGAASSTNGRVQCDFAGVVIATGGLEGRYGCARNDGVTDAGSFQVTP